MTTFKIADTDEILCDRCNELVKGGRKMDAGFYCEKCYPKQIEENVIRSVIKLGD